MEPIICNGCGKELELEDDFHESDEGITLCITCLPDGIPEEDWLI